MSNKIGYKNCVYDKYNHCIWLKEVDDVDYKKIPYEFDYYSVDKTGASPIRDIHRTFYYTSYCI